MAHLYIATRTDAPGLYKIGKSNDPTGRALQLQAGHCFTVKILAQFNDAGQYERAAHKAMDKFRVTGGPGMEWFRSDLARVLKAIGEAIHPPVIEGPDLTRYIRHTKDPATASTSFKVRKGLAESMGIAQDLVRDILASHAYEEKLRGYSRLDGGRTTRWVYQNAPSSYVALRQDDTESDDDSVD